MLAGLWLWEERRNRIWYGFKLDESPRLYVDKNNHIELKKKKKAAPKWYKPHYITVLAHHVTFFNSRSQGCSLVSNSMWLLMWLLGLVLWELKGLCFTNFVFKLKIDLHPVTPNKRLVPNVVILSQKNAKPREFYNQTQNQFFSVSRSWMENTLPESLDFSV